MDAILSRLTGQTAISDALALIAGIKLSDAIGKAIASRFPAIPYPKLIVSGLIAYFGDRVHPLLQRFGQGAFLESVGDLADPLFKQLKNFWDCQIQVILEKILVIQCVRLKLLKIILK